MARKTPSTDDAGPYSTMATGPTDHESPPLVQAQAPGDAREHGDAPVEVPPPPKYRVDRSQYVQQPGGRVLLREGKVIDGSQYDLDQLHSQGVLLSRVG